jgi:asparagine synthase (glutamine-hydrolysing)
VYAGGFVLPGERTLFDGVHAVPPGHFLRATREAHRVHQYWDVDYPRDDAPQAARSDAEYIEGFRAVLEESVKTRLRADVPVGCYLSGGIDSCAVLGLASLHHDGPVRAYTLTFDGAQYDESVIAEEMARHAGAIYQPIPMTQRSRDNARRIQPEIPFINGHTVAKYMLSRAVRRVDKVVITGEARMRSSPAIRTSGGTCCCTTPRQDPKRPTGYCASSSRQPGFARALVARG